MMLPQESIDPSPPYQFTTAVGVQACSMLEPKEVDEQDESIQGELA